MSKLVAELLQTINNPNDLKKLDHNELGILCNELRQFIIDSVCMNPGHLGASLGVIELTVALHYVYDTPHDKLIWDVGHQAYAHKILTGRRDKFCTNRQYKGISGFPRMIESPYDAFGTGHSSTSISAALGMAIASKHKDENNHHIAVIGDGSMTAGLAFEALNHSGAANTDLLVILNDNGIAIDKNVGALKDYLTDIATSKVYNKLKDEVWNLLTLLNKIGPDARGMVQKLENAIKAALLKQSNLFESFNFRYFGPIDGHDITHLTNILKDLKHIKGPKLLHVVTIKGKGYHYAEKHQTRFHAPGLFDKQTGQQQISDCHQAQPPTYQTVFGQTLLELARLNPKIMGVTPAMPTGCGLNIMMEEMPERVFDVGIAEQHAVTFSAGLAANGMLPFCNIYSSFIQRAYDQIIHDVALQHLPVIFCIDRAGLVGEDGATHHGSFDMSFLRCIPGLTIASPMNEEEMRNLMYTAQLNNHGPFAIRYPKSKGVMEAWETPFKAIAIGKGRLLNKGRNIAVISIGHLGNNALHACKQMEIQYGCHIACYDMRFIKPLDYDILNEVANNFDHVITIEDNALAGGFGSAILEFMNDHNYTVKVKRLGIPDRFIEHGSLKELYRECRYDNQNIFSTIETIYLNMTKKTTKSKKGVTVD